MIEMEEAPDPRLAAILEQVEHQIGEVLKVLYADRPEINWMVEAWALSFEAVGYNQEGGKFRVIEPLVPFTQSISASLGVMASGADSFAESMSAANEIED